MLMHVHQAKEFGEAEVWMNERLMRAAPSCFARFITAFEDGNRQQSNKPVRLVPFKALCYRKEKDGVCCDTATPTACQNVLN